MAADQEEGWPLGLRPLNVRAGLGRARDYFGSMSFNTTMLTGSPSSSTDSSSDLDTESTGSFFHDRSITLGSLLGVSSILELSRRSIRARGPEPSKLKKHSKSKPWIFSLCSKDSIDVKRTTTNISSLGQFLAVERRSSTTTTTTANESRRNPSPSPSPSPNLFVPDEISLAQPVTQPNSLFVNGCIVPPQTERGSLSGQGVPVLFSCMCGQD